MAKNTPTTHYIKGIADGIYPGGNVFNFGIKRNEAGAIIEDGKQKNVQQHLTYMFIRLHAMFHYTGLPDVLPERDFKNQILIGGYSLRAPYRGKIYGFTNVGLGGAPDVNYHPTIATVSNPALNMSARYKINQWRGVVEEDIPEAALIRCDPFMMGLYPLCLKYASLLAETELSIWTADINGRVLSYLSASDDNAEASAKKYLSDIIDGNLGVIADSKFLEGIKAQPNGNAGASAITSELIELNQYLKASWFNEIGVNANWNAKRESINSGEAQLNTDALLPLVDTMLATQEEDIFYANKLFGENVKVEFNSSWRETAEEQEAEIAQAEAVQEDPNQQGTPENAEAAEEETDDGNTAKEE